MAIQEVERSYLRKLDVDEVVRHVRGAVNDHHGLQVARVVLLKHWKCIENFEWKNSPDCLSRSLFRKEIPRDHLRNH